MDQFETCRSQNALVAALREALGIQSVLSSRRVGEQLTVLAADHASPAFGEGLAFLPLGETICRHTLEIGQTLVIPDVHAHPLVNRSPALVRLGAGAYLGTPLPSEGAPDRTLCAIHIHRRDWTGAEVALIETAAARCRALPVQAPLSG